MIKMNTNNNEKIFATTIPTTDKTDIGVNFIERDNNNLYCLGNHMPHSLMGISKLTLLSSLPSEASKRINALLKLQFETIVLEAEFHRLVYDMERIFLKKYENIYKKRAQIISGTYNPTETECDYPDDFVVFKQSPTIELQTELLNNEENKLNIIGIPNFWLNIFKYTLNVDNLVKKLDEPLLKHLIDVTVVIKSLPELAFVLEFKFSPNDYFENELLTKEYLLRCEPETETPFEFDGPEIYKSIGCEIKWKVGKNLTEKMIKHKDCVEGQNDEEIEFEKAESFFNFFNPPLLPEDDQHKDYDNINMQLITDFEIGHYLKERIIPRAVLYYIGKYGSFYCDGNDDDNDGNYDDYDDDDDDDDDNNGDDDDDDNDDNADDDSPIESISTSRLDREINEIIGHDVL